MSCADGELGSLAHFREGCLCLKCTEEERKRKGEETSEKDGGRD